VAGRAAHIAKLWAPRGPRGRRYMAAAVAVILGLSLLVGLRSSVGPGAVLPSGASRSAPAPAVATLGASGLGPDHADPGLPGSDCGSTAVGTAAPGAAVRQADRVH
jgi:hypothetical protein